MAAMTTMTGSGPMQDKLWSKGACDWAEIQEQGTLPLHSAALNAAWVVRGTRLLDAGCGAGTASILASLRGATVSAVDASEGLLEIVRGRLPGSDIRQADLETLPYADETFDAVIANNSVFYAANPTAAMNELARVVRPGGRVVVATWGPADQCQYSAVLRLLGALMPPPPLGSTPGGPFAFAAPGALESLVEGAGLHVVERDEAACPFVFPSAEISWRGQSSSGPSRRAIETSGEERVRAAIAEADAQFTRPDGSVRYDNLFLYVVGVR
ncbi:MAG: class I SAM-dependent methyltransferase [Thermomicrobiales bacterium]